MNSGFIKIAIFLLVSLHLEGVKGQGMPQYSQYMMDGFLINPAIAGCDGYSSYNLTGRQQWIGIPGAPSTFSLSGQTRILKGKYKLKKDSKNKNKQIVESSGRVGLGGVIFNDRNGLMDRTGVQFSYAYHIFFQETQLSFGLSAAMYQLKINSDGVKMQNQDQSSIMAIFNNAAYFPDATFGACITTQKYYCGFSAANLLQASVRLGDQSMRNYSNLRQYYLTGGYKIELNPDYHLEPSILIKFNELPIGQADLTCRLYYLDSYWGGLSYQVNPGTGGDLIILTGIRMNRLYFGYAFDYTLNGIRKYTYGSHEISIGVKLGSSARRYLWLNRY